MQHSVFTWVAFKSQWKNRLSNICPNLFMIDRKTFPFHPNIGLWFFLSYCYPLKRDVNFRENNLWFFALLQDTLRALLFRFFFNSLLRLMFSNFLSLTFLVSDWCMEHLKRTCTYNILVDILDFFFSVLWLFCRLVNGRILRRKICF